MVKNVGGSRIVFRRLFIKELMHDPIFLAGLGKMYVADERFKKNIDKYGEGTAEFTEEGIRIYVENK